MPYLDMRQDRQISFLHTRPCYAKSSSQMVEFHILHGNVNQVNYVLSGLINSTMITIMQRTHCNSVERSYWSRSL